MRRICNAIIRDGPTSEELRNTPGSEDVNEMIRPGRLHWFYHVEGKGEDDQM